MESEYLELAIPGCVVPVNDALFALDLVYLDEIFIAQFEFPGSEIIAEMGWTRRLRNYGDIVF